MRTKLFSLLACLLTAGVLAIVVGAATSRSRMVAGRAAKLEAAVQSALSVAQSLNQQVEAQTLTRELALARLTGLAGRLSVGTGQGYLAILQDGAPQIQWVDRRRGSASSAAELRDGRSLSDTIETALQGRDSASFERGFAASGTADPKPGIAYAARFRPWGILLLASAGTDDLNHGVLGFTPNRALIGGAILIAALSIAVLASRKSRRPQGHPDPAETVGATLGPPAEALAEAPTFEAERTQPPSAEDGPPHQHDGEALASPGASATELCSSAAERSTFPPQSAKAADDLGRGPDPPAARDEDTATTIGKITNAVRQTRESFLYTRPFPGDLGRTMASGDIGLSAIKIRQMIEGVGDPGKINRLRALADSLAQTKAINAVLTPEAGQNAARSVAPPVATSPSTLTDTSATRPKPARFAPSSWPPRGAKALVCQAVPPHSDGQEF